MAFKRLNKENLLYNVNYFKKILPLNTLFCAVVKSNAYGHGVREIVEEINNYVDYYAVTSIKEGVELRNYTKKNILVLRGIDDENLFQVSNCDLELAVFTLADILNKKLSNKRTHDTDNDTEEHKVISLSRRILILNLFKDVVNLIVHNYSCQIIWRKYIRTLPNKARS